MRRAKLMMRARQPFSRSTEYFQVPLLVNFFGPQPSRPACGIPIRCACMYTANVLGGAVGRRCSRAASGPAQTSIHTRRATVEC